MIIDSEMCSLLNEKKLWNWNQAGTAILLYSILKEPSVYITDLAFISFYTKINGLQYLKILNCFLQKIILRTISLEDVTATFLNKQNDIKNLQSLNFFKIIKGPATWGVLVAILFYYILFDSYNVLAGEEKAARKNSSQTHLFDRQQMPPSPWYWEVEFWLGTQKLAHPHPFL